MFVLAVIGYSLMGSSTAANSPATTSQQAPAAWLVKNQKSGVIQDPTATSVSPTEEVHGPNKPQRSTSTMSGAPSASGGQAGGDSGVPPTSPSGNDTTNGDGAGPHWSTVNTPLSPPPSYNTIQPHWFYSKEIEKKQVWVPFSLLDSEHLEETYKVFQEYEQLRATNPNVRPPPDVVATDGGRFDVSLRHRLRHAVYWPEKPCPVRRCTWFYRLEGERSYAPYDEPFAIKLEEEYRIAMTTNTWHRRLEFPEGDIVVIHSPQIIVHYQPNPLEMWEGIPQESQVRPRVVKRGSEDFEAIDDGEPIQIDHLVFVVHGIGPICDLRFRSLPEVVDDFRSISNTLVQSHFSKPLAEGTIGRVEFLPVSWHKFLHGDATGIDNKLKPITLKSIPKLRYFANDTILDVLFYTSPVYCQAIINQVASEINRLYHLFLKRNPTFRGNVSLIGHSLGSVILFDLLLHQPPSDNRSGDGSSQSSAETETKPQTEQMQTDADDDFSEKVEASGSYLEGTECVEEILKALQLDEYIDVVRKEKLDISSLMLCSESDLKELGFALGPRKKLLYHLHQKRMEKAKKDGTIQATSSEQDLTLGATGMAATVNYIMGLAGTGQPFVHYPRLDFSPSCFFAIGSPVAMFLTVRGLDMMQGSFRLPNCPAFLNIFHPFDPVAYRIEPLVDANFPSHPVLIPHHKGRKRMHLEIKESLSRVGNDLRQKLVDSFRSTWSTIQDFALSSRSVMAQSEDGTSSELQSDKCSQSEDGVSIMESRDDDVTVGALNGGKRIDYVLQEKPIESFNEYLFALQSHIGYWESEDTVLLVIKEIYSSYNVFPTTQFPDSSHPLPFTQLTQYFGAPKTERRASSPPPLGAGCLQLDSVYSVPTYEGGSHIPGIQPPHPALVARTPTDKH